MPVSESSCTQSRALSTSRWRSRRSSANPAPAHRSARTRAQAARTTPERVRPLSTALLLMQLHGEGAALCVGCGGKGVEGAQHGRSARTSDAGAALHHELGERRQLREPRHAVVVDLREEGGGEEAHKGRQGDGEGALWRRFCRLAILLDQPTRRKPRKATELTCREPRRLSETSAVRRGTTAPSPLCERRTQLCRLRRESDGASGSSPLSPARAARRHTHVVHVRAPRPATLRCARRPGTMLSGGPQSN